MKVDISNKIIDNKIILFANQKGGVGKTTICGLFSNYLADTRKVSLLVVDADPQQTFANRRKDDSRRQKDIPYNVQSVTIKDPSSTRNIMLTLRGLEGTTIIDTPGSLTQEGMKELP